MISEAWERLSARGPGWYWMGTHLRNGDMYHVCSLARRFQETHGRTLPIYLVAGLRPQMAVASCFSDYFAEIILGTEFLGSGREEWAEFFRVSGLPAFGPNTPILLHPGFAEAPRGRGIDLFATSNDLTWMPLYNRILQLDANAEPVAPAYHDHVAREAESLCRSAGVIPGRSVLLFPYAQSFDVPALNHFAALAVRLKQQGLEVFTSVAGDEVPVEGTQPLFLPFAVLREVAEYAGWIVAIRSGICDITASGRCRKSFIFRIGKELPTWGVNAMNLCRDAIEIPFHVGLQTPDAFCDLVLNDRGSELRSVGPARLSDRLEQQLPGRVSSRSFVELQRDPDSLHLLLPAAGPLRDVGARVFRFTDVPARDHPRWSTLVDRFLQSVARAEDSMPRTYYVCRDHGHFDFFEEVDPAFLLSGQYRAADVFHTVLVVENGMLDALLPEPVRGHVLPIEPSLTGQAIDVGAQAEGYAFSTYLRYQRPFSLSGIQLIDGWEDVEVWGAWSRGRRGSLKFAFSETPQTAFGLFVACRGSLTSAFPRTHYNVRVNGRLVWSGAWEVQTNSRVLRIEVPVELAVTGRLFRLDFEIEEVRSPRQLGLTDDDRQLGIALHWIRLDTPGESPLPVSTDSWFGNAVEFEDMLRHAQTARERASPARVGVFTLGDSPFLHREPESGWHFGEDWGRWSASMSATIRFRFDPDSPVQGLKLSLFAPTHPNIGRFTGSVRLNGALSIPISGDMAEPGAEVTIDRSAFALNAVNELEVISDSLIRPCDLDPENQDARWLGFAVRTLEFV
jgi:hypothetical protein